MANSGSSVVSYTSRATANAVATQFIHTEFTFPASAQTKGEEPPRVLIAAFGDGYQQRVKDGERSTLQTWNLVFTDRNPADLKIIDDFLDGFHGVNAFIWKPPNPWGPRWFVCANWDFTYGDGNLITGINATFEELIGPVFAEILIIYSGNNQGALGGTTLPLPLVVQVLDTSGNPVLGFPISWSVIAGGGHISGSTTSTNAGGFAQTTLTLGPGGLNEVQAIGAGLGGSPAVFTEIASLVGDNWAGNDFDWIPVGPTTDVGTQVNVGDTALGIPIISAFPRFFKVDNWVGQTFDGFTTGATVTAPDAVTGSSNTEPPTFESVGDTSLVVGRIV